MTALSQLELSPRQEAMLRALAVCHCADAYLDCLAEFTDTAAGNLSDCCREHLEHLEATLARWRGAQAVVEMRQHRRRA